MGLSVSTILFIQEVQRKNIRILECVLENAGLNMFFRYN